MYGLVFVAPFLLFFVLSVGALQYDVPVFVHPLDNRLVYGGRWEYINHSKLEYKRADWTCSDISFSINVGSKGGRLPIVWYGERVRMNVTVTISGKSNVVMWKLFEGPWFKNPMVETNVAWINLNSSLTLNKNLTIRFIKLTTAAPFGTGIGLDVFKPSIIRFFGIGSVEGDIKILERPKQLNRKIVAIGASDTAGYCVDGTEDITGILLRLSGWLYVNCHYSYPSIIGRHLNAQVDTYGISGCGVTQNAQAKEKWQLGDVTMPGFYNRTLQTVKGLLWDFKKAQSSPPDVVTISLGGNDFNHQKDLVPSNKTFNEGYDKFLMFLFNIAFPDTTKIIGVCGMGSPVEAKFDPDNNRCRPCPHVEDAINTFKKNHISYASRLLYIFIPCDGSVVTGKGDIGCDGHKNRIGQEKVGKFLSPKIAEIMNWN